MESPTSDDPDDPNFAVDGICRLSCNAESKFTVEMTDQGHVWFRCVKCGGDHAVGYRQWKIEKIRGMSAEDVFEEIKEAGLCLKEIDCVASLREKIGTAITFLEVAPPDPCIANALSALRGALGPD